MSVMSFAHLSKKHHKKRKQALFLLHGLFQLSGNQGKPRVEVSLGKKREIIFRIKNTAGKKIQQTAFPRRFYGNK